VLIDKPVQFAFDPGGSGVERHDLGR
jgi:hypothetical protein